MKGYGTQSLPFIRAVHYTLKCSVAEHTRKSVGREATHIPIQMVNRVPTGEGRIKSVAVPAGADIQSVWAEAKRFASLT